MYQRNFDGLKTDDKQLYQSFPWSTAAKEKDGFKLTFKKYKGYDNHECFDNSFIVHNTNEFPLIMGKENLCEHTFSLSIDVIITPEVFITDKNLIKYSPEKRGCLFQSEKKLQFFKIYSKKNCDNECLSNRTKIVCDCVPFYSIRDKSTKICWSVNETDCFKNVYKNYINDPLNLLNNCNCLSACDSIIYNVEYIHNDFNTNYDEK